MARGGRFSAAAVCVIGVAIVCLLGAPSFVRCSNDDEGSDVLVLTPETFDEVVGKDQHVFVKFYAPWCGHCKRLAPDWDMLGTAFKKVGSVAIAKVDCDAHKDLCSRFSISGYPTLKFFPKGSLTPQDYQGGRTPDDLIEFVNREAGTNARTSKPPSNVVVLTPSNFDAIALDASKNVLVEFYAPWCGHCKTLAPIYERVANAFAAEDGVVIAKVDADAHKDLGGKYGVSGFPTLKWFGAESKHGEDYEGGRTLEDLVKFVNEKAGTKRNVHGGLTADAGLVPELDEIAKEFMSADDESAKEGLLKKAEESASKLTGAAAAHAEIYLKVFKSVLKKGADYAVKEGERISRILKSNAVAKAKETQLTLKKNILSSFAS
ncbi:hypothetical protein CBR_g41286 [Chara braunii]|uniref:protein disulfide-isomerase n=1 Tax=Chara braunii TaxID=69332 RepID=A0A388LVQ5_CHABU|nr:hypothetical protein CBR_g41286 [Chara braunii]|eukprot:GBG86292.1 hypothetical protein CBR_g41286 [Chara braunii]